MFLVSFYFPGLSTKKHHAGYREEASTRQLFSLLLLCIKIFIGGLARKMTIAQFIKHLVIVEKTVQVWHLERREPQVYWFKVEFLLQWQHMKGISWLWKLPLAGNRKCLEGFPNHTENATDV
ncbi:hypothetical protein GLYMA_19G062701v4 [Glycine max]|nr:hypothetical protein GLYMA_19G062701v4 [Glycine max]KAH1076619.1 hypothetical protein GYH30_052219 [Glycine max]